MRTIFCIITTNVGKRYLAMENQAGLLTVVRDGPAGQFAAPELANAGTVVFLFDAMAY